MISKEKISEGLLIGYFSLLSVVSRLQLTNLN